MGGKNKARQLKSRLRLRRRTHSERRFNCGSRTRGSEKELATIQTRYRRLSPAFREYSMPYPGPTFGHHY